MLVGSCKQMSFAFVVVVVIELCGFISNCNAVLSLAQSVNYYDIYRKCILYVSSCTKPCSVGKLL